MSSPLFVTESSSPDSSQRHLSKDELLSHLFGGSSSPFSARSSSSHSPSSSSERQRQPKRKKLFSVPRSPYVPRTSPNQTRNRPKHGNGRGPRSRRRRKRTRLRRTRFGSSGSDEDFDETFTSGGGDYSDRRPNTEYGRLPSSSSSFASGGGSRPRSRLRPKTSTGIGVGLGSDLKLGSAAAMGRALREERKTHEEGVERLKCRLNASQKFTEFVTQLYRAQEEMRTKDRVTAMDLARETGYQRLAAYINSDSAVPFDDLVAETKATSSKILEMLTNQTLSKSKVLGDLQKWFVRVFEDGTQEEFVVRQNRVEEVIGAYTPEALSRDMRRRAHRLTEIQRAFERAAQELREELINQKVEEQQRARERQTNIRRELQLASTKQEQLEEDLQKAIDRYMEVDVRNKALTRMMERFEEEKSNWSQKVATITTKLNLRIQELEKQSAKLEIEKKKKENELVRMQKHHKQETDENDREFERKLEEHSILSERAQREVHSQVDALRRDVNDANSFAKSMAEENRLLRHQIKEGGVRITEEGTVDKVSVASVEVQTTAPTYASKIRVRQRLLKGLESFVDESKKTVFQVQFGSSVVVDRLSKVVRKRIPSDMKRFVTNLCLDNGIHPKQYLEELDSLMETVGTRVQKLADDHNDKVDGIMDSSHARTYQDVIIEESEKAMFMDDASSRLRSRGRDGQKADSEALRRHFVAQLVKEKEELKDEIVERDERIFRLQEQVFEEIEKRKRTKLAMVVPKTDALVQTDPVAFATTSARRTPFVAPPSPITSPVSTPASSRVATPESDPPTPAPGSPRETVIYLPPPKVVTFETGVQCDLQPLSGRKRSPVISARKRSARSQASAAKTSPRVADDVMNTRDLQLVLYETENVELRCEMRRVTKLATEEETKSKQLERSNRHLQHEVEELKQELAEEKEERAKAEKDAFDSILGTSAIRSRVSSPIPIDESPTTPLIDSVLQKAQRGRQSSTSRTVDMMKSHTDVGIDPAKIEKVMEELEFSRSANEFVISRVDELIEDALTNFADLHVLPPSQVDTSASFLNDRPDDFVCLQLSELHQRVVCLYESLKLYIGRMQKSHQELFQDHVALQQKNENLREKELQLKKLKELHKAVLEEKRRLEMNARWNELDDSSFSSAFAPSRASTRAYASARAPAPVRTSADLGDRPLTAGGESPSRRKSDSRVLRASSSFPSFKSDLIGAPVSSDRTSPDSLPSPPIPMLDFDGKPDEVSDIPDDSGKNSIASGSGRAGESEETDGKMSPSCIEDPLPRAVAPPWVPIRSDVVVVADFPPISRMDASASSDTVADLSESEESGSRPQSRTSSPPTQPTPALEGSPAHSSVLDLVRSSSDIPEDPSERSVLSITSLSRVPSAGPRQSRRSRSRPSSRQSRTSSSSRSRPASRDRLPTAPLIYVESPHERPQSDDSLDLSPDEEIHPDEFYDVSQLLPSDDMLITDSEGMPSPIKPRQPTGPRIRQLPGRRGGAPRRGAPRKSPNYGARPARSVHVRPRSTRPITSSPLRPILSTSAHSVAAAAAPPTLNPTLGAVRPGEAPIDVRTFKRAIAVLKEDRRLRTQKVSATFHTLAERKKLERLQAELYSLQMAAMKERATVSRRVIDQLRRMKTFQERKLKKWVHKKEEILERKRINLEKGLAALRLFVLESQMYRQRKMLERDPLLMMTSYGEKGRRVRKRRVQFPNHPRQNSKAFHARPKVRQRDVSLPYL